MPADFYIIGAMKCATSTLAAQLGAQAGIFITDPKEPNFYSDADVFARGQAWYESLFAAAPDGALRGDASTHYSKWPTHPHAAARVHAVTPDARFIYMVRDPLERAISHYRHEWTQGRVSGTPDEAIGTLPALWQYSQYHTQLLQWFAHFPKDRFLILTAERLKVAPAATFSRALSFLGAEGAWRTDVDNANESEQRFRRLPLQDLLIDNKLAQFLRRTLIPKDIRERIRATRKPDMTAAFSADGRARLAEKLAADIAAFGALVGQPLTLDNFAELARTQDFVIQP